MIIDITGEHPKLSIDDTRDAITFFAKELIPRAWDKLYIDVYFSHMKTLYGEVERISRYEYVIDLSKRMGKKTAISTIAHEMVHVKQFFRGELYMLGTMNRWNDRWYKSDVSYFDTPWEIEAYGREVGLTHKYLSTKRKENS